MGFFKKIFRRKEDPTNPRQSRRSGNKKQSPQTKTSPLDPTDRDSPTTERDSPPVSSTSSRRVGPSATTNENLHPSSGSRIGPTGRRPDTTNGSSRPSPPKFNGGGPLTAPRNQIVSDDNKPSYSGPVDLDDTDLEEDSNHLRHQLSSQQLEQFDRIQEANRPKPQFTMAEPIFSAGQLKMDDNDSRSDAESSSFNLSTDAEDTEYENFKRSVTVPKKGTPTAVTISAAAMDATSYATDGETSAFQTDGETSVFPNLPTDDEGRSDAGGSHPRGSRMQIVSVAAPGPATTPSTFSAPDPFSTEAQPFEPFDSGFSQFNRDMPFTTPHSTRGGNIDTDVSGHSHKSSSAFGADPFADFADFGQADFAGSGGGGRQHDSWTATTTTTTKTAQPSEDTSLDDLLRKAKSKSRKGSSVNSAPVVSPSYLRETHGLGSSRSKSNRTKNHYTGSEVRSSHESGASVSDIISNLEAAQKRPSRKSDTSAHSRDATSSVRSAKEKLRARRRASNRRAAATHDSDDSEEKDNDNWLFDEVTGALGPVGIAADLESLSGRSNRSRSSGGGRSHKSHRSHKSSRSRARRSGGPRSSSESVDSHGSKRSHGSRRSRYSTRSYMSQMSEQSRSVANDLLRLEMQLAMVGGSTTNAGQTAASDDNSASRGSVQRTRSARSQQRSRRTRITVTAPPGKLGIILANKADSRGTVVSGVRTSSVLADQISPGDRIVAIDGEDVSLMTVSEITTIMARKGEFERVLTVLTTPKVEEKASGYQGGRYR